MALRARKWLERKTRERAFGQWAEMAESVEFMGPGRIKRLTDEALALRASLNRFLMRGDSFVRARGSMNPARFLFLRRDRLVVFAVASRCACTGFCILRSRPRPGWNTSTRWKSAPRMR